MKFTSVIFIFISIILIFGGVFSMKYARDLAGNDVLIDGYSWSEDGQNTQNLSLKEFELTKISFTLTDCDIEITQTDKDPYVELVNFKPNTYICSTSTKSLNISDDISIADYLSFDGSGVKFSGVWQTLFSEYNSRKYKSENNSRSVVLHLNSIDDLKQINLTLTDCSLKLHDIKGKGDIKITADKSEIELANITSTVLSLSGKKTEYSILNAEAAKFTAELDSGLFTSTSINAKSIELDFAELDATVINPVFTDFKASFEKGSITFDTDYDLTCFGRDLETKNGNLLINGANSGSSFKSDKDTVYPAFIKIDTKEGDIDLKFGDLIIITPPAEGEDPDNGNAETPNP